MHILQEKLLELSKKYDLGNMSLRQIGRLLGEEHPEKIRHHLAQLEKKGLINRQGKTIEKVELGKLSDSGLLTIPILGQANCGPAELYADENVEGYLKLSPKILPSRHKMFAIKAAGSSMNKADIKGDSIESGDYVIVDSENTNPENGDYVLSVIDGAANIKRFYKNENKQEIVLASESTMDYAPIYIHPDDASSYLVNGKVVRIIKNPKM